jgi:molecular chaperone GrpE
VSSRDGDRRRPRDVPAEGWESLAEEVSEGKLAPSPELEEALREAAEAVEAREQARSGATEARAEAAETREEPEATRAELEALRERHLRLQADFENQRRRALKERQDAYQYGHENLVKDLLATVDNLDRAIEHASRSESGDFEGMLQGVELVRRELLAALAKHGVTEIGAQGMPFDPNVHEAMAQQEDDTVPQATVIQVFEKGYRLRDRLLRPARVVVSKRTQEGGAGSRAGRQPKATGG